MKRSVLLIFLLSSFFMVAGCAEQEGPAERAGEKIDESIQNSKDTLSDAVESAAETIEDAGDDIEESAEDASRRY